MSVLSSTSHPLHYHQPSDTEFPMLGLGPPAAGAGTPNDAWVHPSSLLAPMHRSRLLPHHVPTSAHCMEVTMAALISPASAMERMITHTRLERMTARVWRGLPVKPRSLLPSRGPPAHEMNLERPPTHAHLERLLCTRLASLAREVLSWWSLRVPLLLFPSRGGQR
jgi:hypothetical protein